jgi:hypothetical protein
LGLEGDQQGSGKKLEVRIDGSLQLPDYAGRFCELPAPPGAGQGQAYRGFESRSLRHLVSAFAGSPDISQKTPEFLGFRARVCRRRPSPRARAPGIAAAVSFWRICGSVSLLTGNLQGFGADSSGIWARLT